jgi:hypothetical protein
VFCSGADIDMTPANNDCNTTCSAVANRPASQLNPGEFGTCVGQVSGSLSYLYEISLGFDASEPACTIWRGSIPLATGSASVGDQTSAGKIDLSGCENGTYSALFATVSRYSLFTGYSVFPDPSGVGSNPKMVKTTSLFAGKDTSAVEPIATWLETGALVDASKKYFRPTAGWNTSFIKLSSSGSAADLSNNQAALMYEDGLKSAAINDTGLVSGWFCENGNSVDEYCVRAVSGDNGKIQWRFLSTLGGLNGMPLTLNNNNKCSVPLDLSYYALKPGTYEAAGIEFLWANDAGTLKYVGARAAEDGLIITFGKPTC